MNSSSWDPDFGLWIRAACALGPVLLFLLALTWLDSYKLIRPRRILGSLIAGGAVGILAYAVNTILLDLTRLPTLVFATGLAPFVEETLKAGFVLWCLRSGRAGFLVDAAIVGFATGAGFSVLENIYYLNRLPDSPLIVWLIRGFGTAVMHGGCTAVFAVMTRSLLSRSPGGIFRGVWPGLLLAALLHAGFNRAMVQPIITTVVMVLVLPAIFWMVYRRGERVLRDWVGRGFDRDQELLALIRDGNLMETPLGRYLFSLRESFRSDTVADMLCLLRLQAELSIIAKGNLLLREHGFRTDPAEGPGKDLAEKLAEAEWLKRSVGRAGLLALRPLDPQRDRGSWEMKFLTEAGRIKGT